MIGVEPELAPSSLLNHEQVSQAVQTLLSASRACRQKREWRRCESLALDACRICEETSDHVGLALARVHLADFYGDVGEVGLAIQECEKAHRVLRRQAARAQRLNEAVAAYALGILYELQLSGAVGALRWYNEALEQLEAAQEYWATLNAISQVRDCQRLRQEIRRRSDRITAEGHTSPHAQRAAFDIWRLESADDPFTDHDGVQGYVIGEDRVLIDGVVYRPEPAISTDETNYCFGLPVSESKWAVPGARAGDYVFVRQQWQVEEEEIGVVWEPGSGWVAVGFKRGHDGQISFYPLRPKVIDGAETMAGDPVGKVKGYIIGLMKPEK